MNNNNNNSKKEEKNRWFIYLFYQFKPPLLSLPALHANSEGEKILQGAKTPPGIKFVITRWRHQTAREL